MDSKNFGRALLIGAVILFSTTAAAFVGDGTAVDWRMDRAGAYLDTRQQTWLEFSGADRGEGPSKSSCISCHTVVPYTLARPALRKLSGAGQPTLYETRFIDQTKKRVERWKELDSQSFQLLYDFSEQKKKEARGTEAVLNSLILAFDDLYQGRKEPSEFTKKAFANLWQTQLAQGDQKGSWEWLNFGLEPWESKSGTYFGAAIAAIAVGTAPGYYARDENAGVVKQAARLRSYLRDHFATQNLHNQIWLLWASTKLDGLLTKEEESKLVRAILKKQHADGGWSLSSLGTFVRNDRTPQAAYSDGYATGLILHVLQTAGVAKNDVKVANGLSWLKSHQMATGEWPCVSVNKKRNPATHVGKFMTDAATAYAVLALSH